MIIRDFSPIPYQGGKLPITDLLKAILKYGWGWTADMQSQDIVVYYLMRTLDNSYTLLRNLSLPDTEVTIPFILVGPPGVTVFDNSPVSGIFRARENVWAVMNKRDGTFRPSKPNLVLRTTLITRAVDTYIVKKGFKEISVDGVLVLTDPGAHVDTDRPEVRVVLVDGLDRVASQISSLPPVMDRESRYRLIQAIELSRDAEQPVPSAETPQSGALPQALDSSFDQAVRPLRKKAAFSRRQWMILGAFVIAEVIILLIFLFMIMLTA